MAAKIWLGVQLVFFGGMAFFGLICLILYLVQFVMSIFNVPEEKTRYADIFWLMGRLFEKLRIKGNKEEPLVVISVIEDFSWMFSHDALLKLGLEKISENEAGELGYFQQSRIRKEVCGGYYGYLRLGNREPPGFYYAEVEPDIMFICSGLQAVYKFNDMKIVMLQANKLDREVMHFIGPEKLIRERFPAVIERFSGVLRSVSGLSDMAYAYGKYDLQFAKKYKK